MIGPTERVTTWTDVCLSHFKATRDAQDRLVVGVLPGEGVGPEVIACALDVLKAISDAGNLTIDIRHGGAIGRVAEAAEGRPLTQEVIDFCRGVFANGGAILNGPGGGRYVYDLRKELDLFLKISPLQSALGVSDASPFKAKFLSGIDILVTRENTGGVYQGEATEVPDGKSGKLSYHAFHYSESQVRRFLDASARLAALRSGRLAVAWKEAGIPGISNLWRECAEASATDAGVHHTMVDIDLLSYRLMREPKEFDVIAAPNLYGDVLADMGAVLLGGRGLSYSGNYSESGDAVYQTNHGSAYDLAGMNTADPGGQILSVAMMLRETFGLGWEADVIQDAVRKVWKAGYRTPDIATSGCRVIGTREIGMRVAQEAIELLRVKKRDGG